MWASKRRRNYKEGYRPMAKQPTHFKNKQPFEIEVTLGDFKAVPNGKKRIDLYLLVPFSRIACRALGVMMDYYVDIIEPDRGAPRKPLPDGMRVKIANWTAKAGKPKQGGFADKQIVIKCEGDFSQTFADGLFQIAEATPSTLLILQTDLQLPLSVEEEDGGEEEDDPQTTIPGTEAPAKKKRGAQRKPRAKKSEDGGGEDGE